MGLSELIGGLRGLRTRTAPSATIIHDPHREVLPATHVLPKLEMPKPLFPTTYETLDVLHKSLGALPLTVGDIPPFVISIPNSQGEAVGLVCDHESHAEGHVQKLIFTHADQPVTTYYLTRQMDGEIQILVRYNHNGTGVLEPMPEHGEPFANVVPPSATLETHMTYGLTIGPSGNVRDPQASLNYGFKNKEGTTTNTNVHMLPIPTGSSNSPGPFIDYIVGQMQTAVTAIPTSA